MKVKEYPVIKDCVEAGVSYGYTRAFKYQDEPPLDHIVATITDAVMAEMCEYIKFEDLE